MTMLLAKIKQKKFYQLQFTITIKELIMRKTIKIRKMM